MPASTPLLAVVVGLLVWVIADLGPPPAAALAVRTEQGLTVLDEAGSAVVSATGGQLSPDGAVVVHAQAQGARGTRVIARDTATGELRWSAQVNGRYAVRLVADGGIAAVLGEPLRGGDGLYVPDGRRRTRMAVVSRSGSREFDLDGNFEPEAVSLDGSSVFVIQYTPPMAPETYQVRRLDLVTGEVVDVFTPDEELQQEMGGTARTQAASSDGRRLYTLYTLAAPDGSHSRAFIHVLDLEQLWAHCIDLPSEFTGEGASTALAVAPDGTRLFVADRGGGVVAAIDTAALQITQTEQLWSGGGGDQPTVAVASAQQLFVSAGSRIDIVDAASLRTAGTLVTDRPVAALHLRERDELVVGHADQIVTLDPVSQTTLHVQRWKGMQPIIGLGNARTQTPGVREAVECAC